MIVLDASALVEVLVGGTHAEWALAELVGHDIVAPSHQPAEVLSAIARLVRARAVSSDEAITAIEAMTALPQDLVAPTAAHLGSALLGQERVRTGDGLYVALAVERQCALVTTDVRLARSGAPVAMRAPSSLEAGDPSEVA